MMKFAFLIAAHNNTKVLGYLLRMIDSQDHDIYIHWDLKSSVPLGLCEMVKKSRLSIIEERYDVRWGSISQVKAEYALFKAAFNSGVHYDYYHLLSGTDLPIKSNEYFQSFFSKHAGKNFVGFCKETVKERVEYKHIFLNCLKNRNILYTYCDKLYVALQKLLNMKNLALKDIAIAKGTNWCSVTENFVKELIEKEQWVIQSFAKARNPDEHYKQTIAINGALYSTMFDTEDEYNGCQRLIDWNRGRPYCWKIGDLEEILKSNYLFCRKIENEELAKELYNKISEDHG